MRYLPTFLLLCICFISYSQQPARISKAAGIWADSVYNTLPPDERIAQLMVVRLSSIDLKTNKITWYDQQVAELIRQYNIGSICLFQGSPVLQANLINSFQAIAKTPLMVCIDAEWGLGQRIFDSVLLLPKQMMLGAMAEAGLMKEYGKIVAEQCKHLGIHVNYAPVVDVNNNPQNPVINDRSFGEDKYKVAAFATEYMKGMQENGIMAVAKHFPGHGDVVADSHLDLPVINKTMLQLDSLELFPFRAIFKEGIAGAMMAHLFIPAIEPTKNMATSLSKNNVTDLLRNKLGFNGLTFTDALDMQAVQKFFPEGESSVESLIAGNDMLCLPADVPQSINKIKIAINANRLSWKDIEQHCKKVLLAKYFYVKDHVQPINTTNLTSDLNKDVNGMRKKVAASAITLLSNNDKIFFPLQNKTQDIAYVGLGIKSDNAFAARMHADYNATVYYADLFSKDSVGMKRFSDSILQKHSRIIIGIHNINRRPANNFDIGKVAKQLVTDLQKKPSILFLFGNAYAAANWCDARNFVVCYEDDEVVQQISADMLNGKLEYKGCLPVTVCKKYPYGFGVTNTK